MMIMKTSTEESVHFNSNTSNTSMSSFMSCLLKERATQFSMPNSNWSITIVDDNARPKHIDKRKILSMQQKRHADSARDMRWGGGSSGNSLTPSASETSLSSRATSRGSSRSSSRSLKPSSSETSLSARTDSRGPSRSSQAVRRTVMDLKEKANANSRFAPIITTTNRSSLPPTVPGKGLRRAAASDTMLLKMPVRTKSPRVAKARHSVGAVAQANSTWATAANEATSSMATVGGLLKSLPPIDLSLDDTSTSTATTIPLENDWMSYSSSHKSSLSRGSSCNKMMSQSSNDMQQSSALSTKKKSSGSRNDNTMKMKKSEKRSSSDSLKQRASLLGLDLK
ncbi:unnamed protein product [Cylindrotheca closterium]|uniref:Uncharacterized protein n=1 Tax=Cylindrotheca closterium TaxID=2856 RepID=A0AAD2FQZ2_9STRA|nr:unnamed protein product [Cylindrotheca closterium]